MIPQQLRKTVAGRANGCCEYCRCQEKFSPDPFEVEHIIPRSQGGTDDLENLAWSCGGCNGYKGTKTKGRDPVTGELVPLYNPRSQHWSEHFAWNADWTEIIAKSATGRATVIELKLNRQPVINLRSALAAYGEHPPEQDE